MEAIKIFLNEMQRSDWFDNNVPLRQRKYNDITVYESEQTYYKKISYLYTSAVIELVEVQCEKYNILQQLVEETKEKQQSFELPSEELLTSLMADYRKSHNQIVGLKEDYEYLCFVKKCMEVQMYFLECFKKKMPYESTQTEQDEEKGDKRLAEEKDAQTNNNAMPIGKVIKGVNGLATFLGCGITKAQDILNSKILQKNGIAYRVGKCWNIDSKKLTELLSRNPDLFYKRNK